MSVSDVGFRRRRIRFFLEGRHFHQFAPHGIGRVDVTVAGLGTGGGDSHGDDGVGTVRRGERFADYFGELGSLEHQRISGGHDDVGRRVPLLDLPTGVGDAGSRVPCLRFRQDLFLGDIRKLFPDDIHILFGGHHPELVRGTDRQEPLHCQLDEGLPHPEDVDELLRAFRGGKRPQPAADAAGHDNDMGVHYSWSMNAFICGTLA